ncbi:glycosyltransferase family 2 protein [Flavobacterium sp. GNP001]
MITVFTPTYNRAYILSNLYESLLRQDNKNFEWVIVDDGSSDTTDELVSRWIEENTLSIVYCKKENEGKHIAINKGVELAKGDLFFIVDSDDYLVDNAIQIIENQFKNIQNRGDLAGFSFRRGLDKDTYIGSKKTFKDIEATALELRFKYRIEGDMAEVFRTDVLKKFPFPKIDGEKFCTEGLLFIRLSVNYKILWTSKIIYIGGYLQDGLTNSIFQIRKKSPVGTTNFYKELSKMPIDSYNKLRAIINYWRFARYLNISFKSKWRQVDPAFSLVAYPLSLVFYLKDR